jgi:hypothetical protein
MINLSVSQGNDYRLNDAKVGTRGEEREAD